MSHGFERPLLCDSPCSCIFVPLLHAGQWGRSRVIQQESASTDPGSVRVKIRRESSHSFTFLPAIPQEAFPFHMPLISFVLKHSNFFLFFLWSCFSTLGCVINGQDWCYFTRLDIPVLLTPPYPGFLCLYTCCRSILTESEIRQSC